MTESEIPETTFVISKKKAVEEKVLKLQLKEVNEDTTFYIEKGKTEWDLYVSAAEHVLSYGNPLEITLQAGEYELIPTGGACNDYVTGPLYPNWYWTWHLATSQGELGGTYSMLNLFPTQAGSAEQAFDSVRGTKLTFYWDGGTFKMWIPADDISNNNGGGQNIKIKKVA